MRWFHALLVVLIVAIAPMMPAVADDAAARAEMVALWSKMFTAKDVAYRAHMVSTDKKGRTYETDMEVQWPNKFRMKTPDSDMIILPQGTWMNAGGQWMKLPMDMSKVIQQYTPDAVKSGLDGMKNVRSLGAGVVNGKACNRYAYDYDQKVMGIRSTGSAEVALEVGTGYPVRMETTGEAAGQKSTVVVDYEYDPSIRITPPN